jgi:hypothetical protein
MELRRKDERPAVRMLKIRPKLCYCVPQWIGKVGEGWKCELLPHFPRQGFVHTVGKGYSYLGLDGNCMPVYQIN